MDTVPLPVLFFSVVFKFIAMIIGVFGNTIVLINTMFMDKEKTATSYLIGNLALADLCVCLTLYPIWIIEFVQTILNIDNDQELFCKLSRSITWSLLFASVAALFFITSDLYSFIVKPLKYPLIVTRRRVILAILASWLIAFSVLILLVVESPFTTTKDVKRSFCVISNNKFLLINIFITYIPLTLIFILNFRMFTIARTQRKRIVTETVMTNHNSNGQNQQLSNINRFFHALKAAKTFSIVVAVLTFCVLIPTVVGIALEFSCESSCSTIWYVVIHYEFIGINSIVNAFIYGMRHIKYKKAYGNVFLRMFCGML